MSNSRHIPVMVEEALAALDVQPGGRYIDCTLGGGGHSRAILENSLPGGQVMGLDADPKAVVLAKENLNSFKESMLIVNDNFSNLEANCIKYDVSPVNGIIFDLGLSSLQLSNGGGFSFQRDAALDMRFNPRQEITAADIINNYTELELARLIRQYGEEGFASRIARHIVKSRPVHSTLHLARIIERAVGRRGRIHPATKTFQALRIAVNHELENLETALCQAVKVLGYQGRLVVISYHSLEDRIVKKFMNREVRDCICLPNIPECRCEHSANLRFIHRRALKPTEEEIRRNPRSRSARLRVAARITAVGGDFNPVEDPGSALNGYSNGWRRPGVVGKIRMVFAAA
ncbi:16S rRNA (cytosine(1402)-N(4))-methyltransferase RsmH [Chloroflexota bacterium]